MGIQVQAQWWARKISEVRTILEMFRQNFKSKCGSSICKRQCHNSWIQIVQQLYGQNKLAPVVVVIKRKKYCDQSRIFNVIYDTNSGRVLDRIKEEISWQTEKDGFFQNFSATKTLMIFFWFNWFFVIVIVLSNKSCYI